MTAFCKNDPINQFDPNGLNPYDVYSNNPMCSVQPQLHKLLEFKATSQYDKDSATVLFYEGVAAKDFAAEIGYFFGDLFVVGPLVGAQQLSGHGEAAGNTMLKLEEWGYRGCQLRNQISGSSYWSSAGNTIKNYGMGFVLLPQNIWDNGVGAIDAARNGDMATAGYKACTANLSAAMTLSVFAKGGFNGKIGTPKEAFNNLFSRPFNRMFKRGEYKNCAELNAFREQLAARELCQFEIDAIVAKYLGDYDLSCVPKYDYALNPERYYGASKKGSPEVGIGPLAMKGGELDILWTILHEDYHVKFYADGFPKGTHCEYTIDTNVGRYFSGKGLTWPESARSVNNYKTR